jgi:hypothetical protein
MKIVLLLLTLGMLLSACSTQSSPTVGPQAVRNETKFSGEYYDVVSTDRPPILIRPVAPDFPHHLRRAGFAGEVTFCNIVEKDGTVCEAQIRKRIIQRSLTRRWPSKGNGDFVQTSWTAVR